MYSIFRVLVLLTCASTGVVSTLFILFILSSFYYLIICANFPFFLHHRQSTPPFRAGMQNHMTASTLTAKRVLYDDDNAPRRC